MNIDFHSHVLPAIDDGSASLAESLGLLRLQAQQGITHTVATPHFYPRHHQFASFLSRRQEAVELLQAAMAREDGLPELIMGAEVRYFPGIGNCEQLNQLTIGGRSVILIEMPHGEWTSRMYQDLADISEKQELTPVIAHVDRYLTMFSEGGIPQKLMDAGCLIQANASFFLSAAMRPLAMRLLRREQIHLLGSDCHDLQQRPPRLGQARQKIQAKLGSEALSRLDALGSRLLFGA